MSRKLHIDVAVIVMCSTILFAISRFIQRIIIIKNVQVLHVPLSFSIQHPQVGLKYPYIQTYVVVAIA